MTRKSIFVMCVALLIGAVIGAQWKPMDVEAQELVGSVANPDWILHTRSYPAGRKETWDAYLYNMKTGEVWFINQDVKSRVEEGKAKGGSNK